MSFLTTRSKWKCRMDSSPPPPPPKRKGDSLHGKSLKKKEIPCSPKNSVHFILNSQSKKVKVTVQFQIILQIRNIHYSAI